MAVTEQGEWEEATDTDCDLSNTITTVEEAVPGPRLAALFSSLAELRVLGQAATFTAILPVTEEMPILGQAVEQVLSLKDLLMQVSGGLEEL